ncbi:MAG: aldo/keto reductase [Bacteroidetes bacterium]|nr:aldo/keto reductase [Bacteroidota bacterium]
METLSLTTRHSSGIPFVGFGTYQLSSDQAEVGVREALKSGYRHIDSAEAYQNADGTGKAIRESGLNRSDLFITTKLFPGYKPWGAPEKSHAQTIESLKNQLVQLQLDYVDLFLIHSPMAETRLEQWQALIDLQRMGLTRHIGVSNYGIPQLKEITEAGMAKPFVNQVEFHPLCMRPALTRYMQEKSIAPMAYSSLAPLSTWRPVDGQGGNLLTDRKTDSQTTCRKLALKYQVSESQILLRWGLQHGYLVIPRSTRPERIRQNIDLFGFSVSPEDMALLDGLNQDLPFAWAGSGLDPMETAPIVS